MSNTDQEKQHNLQDLNQPLIEKQTDKQQIEEVKVERELSQPEDKLDFLSCMKTISGMAIYPIIGMIFHPAYHIINSAILGKIDPTLLAALGLGGSTVGMFLLSIGVAFNGSLGTLIPQAVGQKNYRLAGLYLNRQLFMAMFIFLPLIIPLLFCERIFLAMGQDPAVASEASKYVLIMIPGCVLASFGQCFNFHAMGHRVTHNQMIANITATVVHIILTYIFTSYFDWRMTGIAISSSIHFATRAAVSVYLVKSNPKINGSLVAFSDPESRKNLKGQLILSFQCMGLSIWSWWAFDVFTFISSYMSVNDLAAQTILRNIGLLTYMIPVGISFAAAILIGNNIGAMNIHAAKTYAKYCTLTAHIWAVLTVIVINVASDGVLLVFGSTPEINELIMKAYATISVFCFFDCTQGVGQGIIRGLGKQGLASYGTITGYWILGIPISLYMVFYKNEGITGLWVGPNVGIIFNFTFYYLLILRSDFTKIALEARERSKKDQK